ncbi:MAG: hypothetical protein JSW07_14730 [bacterium]|nr:MAG: hypothetical protein JSW07_14730 [bacterium]
MEIAIFCFSLLYTEAIDLSYSVTFHDEKYDYFFNKSQQISFLNKVANKKGNKPGFFKKPGLLIHQYRK